MFECGGETPPRPPATLFKRCSHKCEREVLQGRNWAGKMKENRRRSRIAAAKREIRKGKDSQHRLKVENEANQAQPVGHQKRQYQEQ
jgi:hypothetical protein